MFVLDFVVFGKIAELNSRENDKMAFVSIGTVCLYCCKKKVFFMTVKKVTKVLSFDFHIL